MNSEDKDFTQRGYLKLSFSLGNWLRINAYPKYTNALYRSQMLMFQTGILQRVQLNLTFDPYNWIQGHCIPSILNH